MKVYLVCQWHTPSVQHGYEPEAIFLSKAKAEAQASEWNAKNGVTPHDGRADGYNANEGECTVEEWDTEDEFTPDRERVARTAFDAFYAEGTPYDAIEAAMFGQVADAVLAELGRQATEGRA